MKIAAILWRLALTCFLGVLAWRSWFLLESTQRVVESVPGELQATRAQLLGEAAVTRAQLLERTDAAIARLDRQLSASNDTLDRQSSAVIGILDRRTGELVAAAKPALDNSAALVADAQASLDDLYPDLKAAVESGTVTSTSVAHAAQDISALTGEFRRAVPVTLAGLDRIVANSDQTTAAGARVLTNLDLSTRPLPKWMRWTFGITGQLAPTAAGALGAAAAAGAFR